MQICYLYQSDGYSVKRTLEDAYYGTHKEADSTIVFHSSKVDSKNIVIRVVDTDVLIITLGSMHAISTEKNVWIETGIYSKNILRYLNINKAYDHYGQDLYRALPEFHAFTGCDYTGSFGRKGKTTPLKILQKDEGLQKVFIKLGRWSSVEDDNVKVLESFVCRMYGKRKLNSVNAPKNKHNCLVAHMKSMDASVLPPCSKVQLQKIKRTSYITRVWQKAVEIDPTFDLNPTVFGWLLKDDYYQLDWFEGDAAPKIVDVVKEDAAEDSKDFNLFLFSLKNFETFLKLPLTLI